LPSPRAFYRLLAYRRLYIRVFNAQFPAPPRINVIVALNEAHNMYGVNSQDGKFTLGDTDGRETEVVVEKPVTADGNCWECWVDEKTRR
jgi:hypothetical protein